MATKPDPLLIRKTLNMQAAFVEALQKNINDPHMTLPQLILLLQLYVHRQIMQQDLPKYTMVAKSANSRNVAKLGDGERPYIEKGPGWVEAYEDPMDRRTKIVRLTPTGQALLETAAQEAARYLARDS